MILLSPKETIKTAKYNHLLMKKSTWNRTVGLKDKETLG